MESKNAQNKTKCIVMLVIFFNLIENYLFALWAYVM